MVVFSPCGINCRDCDAYIATQNDDIELSKQLQRNYMKQFAKEISMEELKCDGCQGEGRKISFCSVCEVRVCATEHGYVNCAECAELPCEKGSFIWQENSVSLANLLSERKQID